MTSPVQAVSLQSHPVMSDAEREFASENHGLIYSFLRQNHWDPEEYYDIAAWGYLQAVMRYFRVSHLRKYPFFSVAWKAMRHSITVFHRSEARRQKTEQRYAESAPPGSNDLFSELEANLLLQELVSGFDEKQYKLASMRLKGYSLSEIAQARGMPQQRVSKLLRALYRAYLKRYQE